MQQEMDIQVRELTKRYKVPVREGGFRASVASLFHRKYRVVEAVTVCPCASLAARSEPAAIAKGTPQKVLRETP